MSEQIAILIRNIWELEAKKGQGKGSGGKLSIRRRREEEEKSSRCAEEKKELQIRLARNSEVR